MSAVEASKPTDSSKEVSSFSQALREAAGDSWERIRNHKFGTELATGTLDQQVLARYLIQDERFLDAFLQLIASILIHAHTPHDRIVMGRFLGVLTSRENTFFERSFAELGITKELRDETPNTQCTKDFLNLLRDTATNPYLCLGERLAVALVCEWTYLEWATRVEPLLDESKASFICKEWIALHTGPSFEGIVNHLRDMMDRFYSELEASDMHKPEVEIIRNSCQSLFQKTVQLEEAFFDEAYRDPEEELESEAYDLPLDEE